METFKRRLTKKIHLRKGYSPLCQNTGNNCPNYIQMASMDLLPHQKNFPPSLALLLSRTSFPLYPCFVTLLSDSYMPHFEMMRLARERGVPLPSPELLFLLYQPSHVLNPPSQRTQAILNSVSLSTNTKFPEKPFRSTNT